MLVFSEIHNPQDDPNVKQILVFPNEFVKVKFEKALQELKATSTTKDIDDNGIGSIYKLRAVKDFDKGYAAIIRCGVTGRCLWEDVLHYEKPEPALVQASFALRDIIYTDINQMVSEIDCN